MIKKICDIISNFFKDLWWKLGVMWLDLKAWISERLRKDKDKEE